MENAAVILFVYNRPEHTLATLQALAANQLAEQSKLYIYADGPKNDAQDKDRKKIEEVRHIIRQENWCKHIEIIEQKHNIGLAKSIISGVSEVTEKHGKAIILEDDIVTSPGFLSYMNDALRLYEQEEKVMHISGYMYPVEAQLSETFFYNNPSCWGWATWQSAWQYFNTDTADLLKKIKQKSTEHFNINGSYNFLEHLELNLTGELNTWAIYWYASVYLNDGLCLHPQRSLTQNIGMDGSGVHCDFNRAYDVNELAQSIAVKPIPLEISGVAREAMMQFYNKLNNPSWSQRIYRKLRQFLFSIKTVFVANWTKVFKHSTPFAPSKGGQKDANIPLWRGNKGEDD